MYISAEILSFRSGHYRFLLKQFHENHDEFTLQEKANIKLCVLILPTWKI